MMQPVVPNMTSDEDKVTIAESKFRILLVSYYCPSRAHAGGLRILDIYALIRKQCPSVQLDLFTFHRPSIDWSLDDAYRVFHNVYLSPVEDLTPTTLTALSGSPLAYDLVDLQFHQSAYNIDAYKQVGKKVIFTPMESAAKVLFLDLRTNFHLSNFLPLRKFAASIRNAAEELVFIQKVDEVVCVSRADAAFLRALTSSRHIRGVDTGVSQFEFKEALALGYETTKAANKPVSVIYVAYFGSETNVLALRWYLEHVHPLVKASVPDYTLIVVGRGDLSPFSKYRDISVKFVGEVPSIAPHIKEARVSIAPALSGSGFRGKVNQYAVLGCPCVVSPIAFKGLSYQDGDSIFVAETPEVFADRCIQLLTDLDLNDRMGIAARQLCMERYSWASKWAAIREIYKLQGIA
jgi:glycosyltransferase involved in cell wall biosynthesis